MIVPSRSSLEFHSPPSITYVGRDPGVHRKDVRAVFWSPSAGKMRRRIAHVTMQSQPEDSTPKKILSNIFEGQLGQRGEVYVALQFALIFLLVSPPFSPLTLPIDRWLSYFVGLLPLAIGIGLGGVGSRTLGSSLTPFPKPSSNNELKTDGGFAFCRHPIYGGLLLSSIGFAIQSASLTRMLVTLALFVLLEKKSEKEETWLCERYAQYPEYSQRTPKYFPDPTKIPSLLKEFDKVAVGAILTVVALTAAWTLLSS